MRSMGECPECKASEDHTLGVGLDNVMCGVCTKCFHVWGSETLGNSIVREMANSIANGLRAGLKGKIVSDDQGTVNIPKN